MMYEEKFYAGLSFGFNSSACVVSNKRGVLAAISQERLNGEKNTKQIPIDALLTCCKIAGVNHLERIAYSHYQDLTMKEIKKYVGKEYEEYAYNVPDIDSFFEGIMDKHRIKVDIKRLYRVNHHTAHMLSGMGVYGMHNNYVAVTSDGFGDGISGRIFAKYNDEQTILSEVSLKNSIALVYQFVTGALGYKMHQHEGKITGLAAFGQAKYVQDFYGIYYNVESGNGIEFPGNPSSLTEEDIEMIENSTIQDFKDFLELKHEIFDLVEELKKDGATDADIAASVQEFAEVVTTLWINNKLLPWLKNHDLVGKLPCYIAGGLFANVKLNQRIKDMGIFKEVLVSPAMGDEGTAVGSAIKLILSSNKYEDNLTDLAVSSMDKVCVGTKILKEGYMKLVDEFEKANTDKVSARVMISNEELISDIVDSLAHKKIVCLCQGQMEFGPRALCHRSILYDCTDASVNDWLNKQLSRTEFMPFAPVCLEDDATDLFKSIYGGYKSAQFMTMTFDCKEEFVLNYPAACHIDKTARPQLVTERTDEMMYKILTKYKAITKKKVLINTSFNLHNYPIIEDIKVAMESWLTSNTDVLVLGNIIIERKDR